MARSDMISYYCASFDMLSRLEITTLHALILMIFDTPLFALLQNSSAKLTKSVVLIIIALYLFGENIFKIVRVSGREEYDFHSDGGGVA